jgi:hypothetical protein
VKKRLLAAATLALAAGSIAAGCGGGDDTTVTGASGPSGATGAQGAPLTKDAFLAKGNAICKQGNQELNQAGKQFFNSLGLSKNQQPSSDQIQQFATDTVVPKVQAQIDGIDALPAPSGDEDQVQAIVDAARQDLDKIKQDPSLLEGNNDPFADANQLAKQYGLNECAGG